jgi:NAD(P)-dependent dehydrogenase (short-subunit alcohol dehydrogenase family)
MGRVQDQVAIVTGGANGIGRACAKIFVEEGARVVIGDIDAGALESAARALTEAGGQVATVLGDVSEEGPAAALVSAAVERFGRLDILVNNVGGNRTA